MERHAFFTFPLLHASDLMFCILGTGTLFVYAPVNAGISAWNDFVIFSYILHVLSKVAHLHAHFGWNKTALTTVQCIRRLVHPYCIHLPLYYVCSCSGARCAYSAHVPVLHALLESVALALSHSHCAVGTHLYYKDYIMTLYCSMSPFSIPVLSTSALFIPSTCFSE